jgi:hypothetical protein
VFEKTRHFAGKEAESFQVTLQESEDGLWEWHIESPQIDPAVAQVAELRKKGLTIRKIGEQTGLTKSQVESRIKQARNIGSIT